MFRITHIKIVHGPIFIGVDQCGDPVGCNYDLAESLTAVEEGDIVEVRDLRPAHLAGLLLTGAAIAVKEPAASSKGNRNGE